MKVNFLFFQLSGPGVQLSHYQFQRRDFPYPEISRPFIEGIQRIDSQIHRLVQFLHRLVSGQSRQDPVQIAFSFHPHSVGKASLAPPFQHFLLGKPFRQFCESACKDQLLSCPCKSHIKDPELFPQAFQGDLLLDRSLENGPGPDPQLLIYPGSADPQIRVKHDTLSGILHIHLFSHTCHKHHRKFQAFTAVDTHDLYCILFFGKDICLSEIHLIFFQIFDIPDKVKQPPVAGAFIISGLFQEHEKICFSLFP